MSATSDPTGRREAPPPPPEALAAGATLADYSKIVDGIYSEASETVSRHALDLQKTLAEAAGSARSVVLANSYAWLQKTKGLLEELKTEYAVCEDKVFGKIKEDIIIAASHPGLSCGVAAGLGLVMFRRPRQMIIRNIRRLFVSEESLLSDAEANVNELRQSINLVKNESTKLEERASKAEAEYKEGLLTLMDTGHKIQKELRYINRLEKESRGLKELIRELPRRDASRYRLVVSTLVSHLKGTKEDVCFAASRINSYGIWI